MMAIGVALFLFSSVFETKPYGDGIITTGTVVDVERSTARESDGDRSTTCTKVVEFWVGERSYRATASVSSSMACDSVGETQEVSYREGLPQSARVLDTDTKWVVRGMKGVGMVVFVLGLATFVVRASTLGLGVWLWLQGHKGLALHPGTTDDGAILQRLTVAWSGNDAQAADSGAMSTRFRLLDASPLGRFLPTASTIPPAPPAPIGPPAGWYSDPAGTGRTRWWDGTMWTEHLQP